VSENNCPDGMVGAEMQSNSFTTHINDCKEYFVSKLHPSLYVATTSRDLHFIEVVANQNTDPGPLHN
jgi:hypothetical protein